MEIWMQLSCGQSFNVYRWHVVQAAGSDYDKDGVDAMSHGQSLLIIVRIMDIEVTRLYKQIKHWPGN